MWNQPTNMIMIKQNNTRNVKDEMASQFSQCFMVQQCWVYYFSDALSNQYYKSVQREETKINISNT